jgi:hypothetical protein
MIYIIDFNLTNINKNEVKLLLNMYNNILWVSKTIVNIFFYQFSKMVLLQSLYINYKHSINIIFKITHKSNLSSIYIHFLKSILYKFYLFHIFIILNFIIKPMSSTYHLYLLFLLFTILYSTKTPPQKITLDGDHFFSETQKSKKYVLDKL